MDKTHKQTPGLSMRDPVDGSILVSIVVPVYSGAEYLTALVAELKKLQSRWIAEGSPMRLLEAVLVDDAAVDSSPELIDQLSQEHSWVTAIHMARNFGQHPATIAGILYSSGDWVVTLDEDLQHPPEKIDDLLLKVAQQSFDIVYAKAEGSVHENYLRDFGSILYKRAIETLTGNSNVRHFNSFRLIRGSVARAAGSVCGHDTYFDVALSWFTQRVGVASMPLKDNRVISGKKSGYRFSKLLSHARRMLMSSGTKVVRLGGAAGLLIVVGSLFSAAIITFRKIFYPETIVVDGWTSLMLAVVFFGGAAAFLMGIVLEYLSMLVINAHGKPIFFTVDRSSDADLAKHFHVEKT